MSDIIFNVKKQKPKTQKSKGANFLERKLANDRDNLSFGYLSVEDPAIEGLDSNYDNRLEKEYKRYGIN